MDNKFNCVPPCTELLLMQKDIQEIKEGQATILKEIKSIRDQAVKDKEDSADRYANKWVERVLAGLLIIMALTSLAYILIGVGLPVVD